MIVDMEVKASAEEIFKRFGYLWKFLDVDKKRAEITELETKMAAPNFWDDHSAAQSVISELTRLKNLVNPLTSLNKRTEDLRALFKLSEGSEFSCGTQNAIFFSVKGGKVNANVSEKLPAGKWLTAKGKMNFPLNGGETWTLSISDGNRNYKCDMQLPKNAGGKPTRFALKSLGGQTRFADLKMDVIE